MCASLGVQIAPRRNKFIVQRYQFVHNFNVLRTGTLAILRQLVISHWVEGYRALLRRDRLCRSTTTNAIGKGPT
jgi:hypothetical protein